jgi:hypothetical protein
VATTPSSSTSAQVVSASSVRNNLEDYDVLEVASSWGASSSSRRSRQGRPWMWDRLDFSMLQICSRVIALGAVVVRLSTAQAAEPATLTLACHKLYQNAETLTQLLHFQFK